MKYEDKSFSGEVTPPDNPNGQVDYDQSIVMENFTVGLPSDFAPQKKYGLMVFIDAGDAGDIPKDWIPVLAERDLLVISPKKAGNAILMPRRTGMGVLATQLMLRDYEIDPKRVFITGISGGARTANSIAFLHPEIYSGAIMTCGAGFIEPIDTPLSKQKRQEYGAIYGEDSVSAETVKNKVKFVFITGEKDFRYKNILDIYNQGYKLYGYQAKLLDVPGMGHTNAGAEALGQALDFIEAKRD